MGNISRDDKSSLALMPCADAASRKYEWENSVSRYLHTEEKQEGETFFDVMNRLIARNKAVTADMEAVLAELESEIEPFRAPKNHE